MPVSLAGAGAGALGAGAAAIPDVLKGNLDQAATGIRQGMAEGAQKLTLDKPIFAPTTALQKPRATYST